MNILERIIWHIWASGFTAGALGALIASLVFCVMFRNSSERR